MYLFCNLSKCILLFSSYISSLLLLFFWRPLIVIFQDKIKELALWTHYWALGLHETLGNFFSSWATASVLKDIGGYVGGSCLQEPLLYLVVRKLNLYYTLTSCVRLIHFSVILYQETCVYSAFIPCVLHTSTPIYCPWFITLNTFGVSKNIKIKAFRTVILLVFYMSFELGLWRWGGTVGLECSWMGC